MHFNDLPNTEPLVFPSAERDRKTLFIKPLPLDITEDQVKALGKEIVDVRIRIGKRGKRQSRA